ncbi:MAG: methyltransferase domain-containing protein [Alphaproteobacteria bacterium]|nr:methyltransferase domain-containing protein [Alphaproteobacteria bacterium]
MLRLNIGGTDPKDGWSIFNVVPGPHVDHVGDILDLGRFADASVDEIYASHVLEHVWLEQAKSVLRSFARILVPGGRLMVSVPDLPTLCRIYLDPRLSQSQSTQVMAMIYGAHLDAHDIHHVGFNEGLMSTALAEAGFRRIRRVEDHGLFQDTSVLKVMGLPISLNMQAQRSLV